MLSSGTHTVKEGAINMNDKERLTEIKRLVFNAIDTALSDNETLSEYEIDIDDLDFLIKLAEKSLED